MTVTRARLSDNPVSDSESAQSQYPCDWLLVTDSESGPGCDSGSCTRTVAIRAGPGPGPDPAESDSGISESLVPGPESFRLSRRSGRARAAAVFKLKPDSDSEKASPPSRGLRSCMTRVRGSWAGYQSCHLVESFSLGP
jgi:hypothetical protein